MASTKDLRIYRTLLSLYPRHFRREYGEAMTQLHADLLRSGRWPAWRRAARDLCISIPTQRAEATMSMSPAGRVVTLTLVTIGATAIAIGIGRGGVVAVVALFVVGLLITQRHALARVTGTRAPLRQAATQTWWAPLATLLGVTLVAAGIGTIFEANNLGGRIAGSGLLIAFGSATLLGLTRRPNAREAGNSLILIGTVPAFPFFWMILPPLAAIVVWIGVLTSGYAERPAVSAHP